ncbi:MAG: EAL domain-containing protein [Salinarimonadaceae bacterium]|nr:MAG: EAL domain-containing protein [Salinarimonadaceae bacterium]
MRFSRFAARLGRRAPNQRYKQRFRREWPLAWESINSDGSMFSNNKNLSHNSSDLLSRLVWVAAILLTGTVALGAGIVATIAAAQNDDAAVFERSEVTKSLERRARDVANKVAAAQAVGDGLEGLSDQLAQRLELHVVIDAPDVERLVFAPPGSAEIDVDDRFFQRLSAWMAAQDIEPEARVPATYGMYAGDFLFVAAAPMEVGRWVFALDRVSIDDFQQINGLSRLSHLEISHGSPPRDANGLAFRDLATGETASLHWSPTRPGDHLVARIGWIAVPPLAATFLLFLLVAINTRRVAADLAASHERVADHAVRDPLSGLPNRVLFSERLDAALAAIRDGAIDGVAIMFLDLDRFKEVNDAYGHQAGDELITQVARRLQTVVSDDDTLARFGGDEFAVIVASAADEERARDVAARILHSLATPFDLHGATVNIGVSIGIALAPRDAPDRETLMRLADTALYEAKSAGRNRAIHFRAHMDAELQMRKVVSDDLRRAIADDELTIYYQPIYSAAGDRVVCLEALVRWPHPTKGLIAPDSFIPLAEQSGLVIPLGEWVLRRVCRDGMRWPGVRLAVNVSPIQFRQRDFVDSVLAVLDEVGFDPSRLELELTEGVVVEDADAAEAAMHRLRDNGFHLALDDFGTGYSSLIYLRRFAFDKIKIDRSFLESLEGVGESAILVHSIVHLGRALGMTVTAEGVETKEQHRFLQALGCHELQGFLFSRPVPPEEIDVLLGITPPRAGRTTAA